MVDPVVILAAATGVAALVVSVGGYLLQREANASFEKQLSTEGAKVTSLESLTEQLIILGEETSKQVKLDAEKVGQLESLTRQLEAMGKSQAAQLATMNEQLAQLSRLANAKELENQLRARDQQLREAELAWATKNPVDKAAGWASELADRALSRIRGIFRK